MSWHCPASTPRDRRLPDASGRRHCGEHGEHRAARDHGGDRLPGHGDRDGTGQLGQRGPQSQQAEHRRGARSHLRAALEMFDRLGARPWAERARTELRAAGDTSSPATSADAVPALSPQELRIVRPAAKGLTNKEIGAQLFLSPKTVSYHLYRAFPKLNVASRAQLAGLDLS